VVVSSAVISGIMAQQYERTAIDLFSGCGGLSEGLKRAGFSVLVAIEIEPAAIATYKLNHPGVSVIPSDIRQIDPAELLDAMQFRRGQLDLLAGCPPCQGYSVLRTRNGRKQNRDQRNGLVREILRFAKEFMPKAIMMENVPGLVGKAALVDLETGLQKLGYKVRSEIKDAQYYGVPQRRRRLIMLAGKGFEIPFALERKNRLTVRTTIGGLPPAGLSGDRIHDFGETRTAKVKEFISEIPPNGGSRRDLGQAKQLRCHKKCNGFKDIYGRMSWDEKAPTITSGCFNPSKGRFLHPESNRSITMREAALLQGFPRRYRFADPVGKLAIAEMIGNALPPEFVRRHAVEVKQAIASNATSAR
jgi:DNA (cytosine-5)-methyltransferase 1